MKKESFYLALLVLSAFFVFLLSCGEGIPVNLDGTPEVGKINNATEDLVGTSSLITKCLTGNAGDYDCPDISKPSPPPPPPPSPPSSAYEPPPMSSSSSSVLLSSSSKVSSSSSVLLSSSSKVSSSSSVLLSSSSKVSSSSSSVVLSSSSKVSSSSSVSEPSSGGCEYQPTYCGGMAKSQITTPANLTQEQNNSATNYCYFLTAITDNRQGAAINGSSGEAVKCGATDWGQKACSEVLTTKVDGGYYVYTPAYGYKVTGTNSYDPPALHPDCR